MRDAEFDDYIRGMTDTTTLVSAAGATDARKIYGGGDNEVKALDGVTVSFSGSVQIGDVQLASLNDKQLTELRRTAVGFIFQAYNLVPTLTALENITLPLLLGGTKGDQEWIDRVIDTVGLRDRLKHRPSELSGGQ